MQEHPIRTLPGSVALVLFFAAIAGGVYALATMLPADELKNMPGFGKQVAIAVGLTSALAIGALLLLIGMFTIGPNEARVLQLFGRYIGTCKDEGWRWVNPFYSKRPISLRMRNFETAKIKVNDVEGNPIEIAAIVVWKVVDTAQALARVSLMAPLCGG
jgi:regulator of protease activity HflC (stomatin/prohibitin superfamily)